MKEEQMNHPTIKLTYQNMPFTITEPSNGKIIIKFEDCLNHYSYSTQKSFEHINYKTLIAALQNTESQIIKAILFPLERHQYELRIKVQLEYVNQIEEVFTFQGIKMSEDKIKQINTNSIIKKKITNLKEEIISLSKNCIINRKIIKREKKGSQIIVNIPFQMTIFSINFSFKNLASNIVKVGFYYYDSLTKSKVSQSMLPDSLFLDSSSNITVLGDKTKFSQALITLDGQFQEATYSIKVEEVKQSVPINKGNIILSTIILGFFVFVFYIFDQKIFKQQTVQL